MTLEEIEIAKELAEKAGFIIQGVEPNPRGTGKALLVMNPFSRRQTLNHDLRDFKRYCRGYFATAEKQAAKLAATTEAPTGSVAVAVKAAPAKRAAKQAAKPATATPNRRARRAAKQPA